MKNDHTRIENHVKSDDQEKPIEIESRIIDFETNKRQLHHLLMHVENQLEEVEKIYQMMKKSFNHSHPNDYMDTNLEELRSLIEIAQDHNRKVINRK